MPSTQTASAKNTNPKVISTIIKAGLIAGTLDGATALIMFYIKTKRDPLIVFKYIASAVFGTDAYAGGASMIIAGIIFHYIIAFSFTILFFLLFPRIKFMQKNPVFAGLIYGIFVWLVMNLGVLPLTRVPAIPFNVSSMLTGTIVLMLMIGLPVSLIIHQHFTEKNRLIENDVV